MNCGLCRDCKWWEKPEDTHHWNGCEPLPDHGTCMAIGETKPYNDNFQEDPPVNTGLIVFINAYEDSGELITRADFGCIQFEAK